MFLYLCFTNLIICKFVFLLQDLKCYTFYPFGPTVEPYVSENCFLPKTPIKMILEDECWGLDLPVIFGVNSDEGLMLKSGKI